MVSIPSDEVGNCSARLILQGLDETWEHHDIELTIHARQSACTIERLADGCIAFGITGARPVALVVPSRSSVVDLHLAEGVVYHGFLLPTLLNIMTCDDLNQYRCHAVALDWSPASWSPLSTMNPLQWMPT